uniref:Putative Shufflon protein D n=1 Tax=mine drainage metagenome TaxID=410659 RepID=E6QVF2_9ZZZZ
MGEMIGVLIAALVALFGVKTYSDYQVHSNNNILAATTASQWTLINTAAINYIQTNAVAIQATATATTPAMITVGMLQAPAVGLLPTTFTSTNPYQQTWQIEVLQPTAGNLQALVMTTGGTVLPDKQAANIANLMGATGGFIPKNDSGLYVSNTAYGTAGSWQVPTTSYMNAVPGELAALLYFNKGQLQSPYLYRNAVPGQPQLNAMNTPLIMNSVQSMGQVCATSGAIAQDGNGVLLSCQSGTWQQQGSAYWKDPVTNFAGLPACNAASAWQTRIVQMPGVGAGPRAYTCNGAGWAALAVDQNGNIYIPGTATMGNAAITGTATVGGTCTPNGLVAQDGIGTLLSCQSGVWGPSSELPVVTSGQSCNSSVNTLGVSSDRQTIYGCQAGTWQLTAGATPTVSAAPACNLHQICVSTYQYCPGPLWDPYCSTQCSAYTWSC